jgi:hypothetical protein
MAGSKTLKIAGGIAIFVLFFFGTLFFVDYVLPSSRNNKRAEDARVLNRALAAYYQKHGAYPGPTDTPIERLKRFLVDEKFLTEIPQDPLHGNPLYYYLYSSDGKTFYGLVIRLEPTHLPWGSTNQGLCLTGVGIETTRVFGDPPPRPCAL